MTIREGQLINNRYFVQAFLGRGGMSDVYLVKDEDMNAYLAIKVLHENLVEDQVILRSFKREASALQNLRHPNIVAFYRIEESQEDIFLVEQYIDGPTLKKVIEHRHRQPMGSQEALTYLKAISAALGYAHKNGVVHCDMKPANVMVDRDGNIYLTDFGIARHAESTATDFGGPVGTLAYMAPEQLQDEVVVYPATDVYSVGVMMFELLTGRRPFEGGDPESKTSGRSRAQQIRRSHLEEPPPDPRTYNPYIPFELADVILKALEKDPIERQKHFPTILDFYQEACKAAGVNPDEVDDRTEKPAWFPPLKPIKPTGVSVPPASPPAWETQEQTPAAPVPPPIGPTQVQTPTAGVVPSEQDAETLLPVKIAPTNTRRNLLILLGALAVVIIAAVLLLPKLLNPPDSPASNPSKVEQPAVESTSAANPAAEVNTTEEPTSPEQPAADQPTEAAPDTDTPVPTSTHTLTPTDTPIPTDTSTPLPTLQPVVANPTGCGGKSTYLQGLKYAYIETSVTLFGVPRYSTINTTGPTTIETTPIRPLMRCERVTLLEFPQGKDRCSRNTYFYYVETDFGERGYVPEYYVRHEKDQYDEKNYLSVEGYYLVPNPPVNCP